MTPSLHPAEDAEYFLDMEAAETRTVLDYYTTESRSVRERPSASLELSYGAHPREILDIFTPDDPGRSQVPCVIFVHGGWWKGGRPQDRAFLAPGFTSRGYGFANIGYPLAPEASLGEIFASVQRALAWLRDNGAAHGLDMRQFVLAGNSAGGHLAAMLGSARCLGDIGIPTGNLKGLCALSGLYDLAPLRPIFVNDWLRLDDDTIAALSPVGALPPPDTPVFLGLGEREPTGFDTQRGLYAERLSHSSRSYVTSTTPAKNHFEVIEDIGTPGAEPFEFILQQLKRNAI